MAGIKSGDQFYVIDDVSELRDVLEFYPSGCIDVSSIAGKVAIVIDGPQLSSESWDGCITLSFDNGISQCRLPVAALDMGRVSVVGGNPGNRNTSRSPSKSSVHWSPTKKDSLQSPFMKQSQNTLVTAPNHGDIFDGEVNKSGTMEREIIYVRDTSSESVMIRNLAAESIQDAYR